MGQNFSKVAKTDIYVFGRKFEENELSETIWRFNSLKKLSHIDAKIFVFSSFFPERFVGIAIYASRGKNRRKKFFSRRIKISFFILDLVRTKILAEKNRKFNQNCTQLVQSNFLRNFVLRRLFFRKFFELLANKFLVLLGNVSAGFTNFPYSCPAKTFDEEQFFLTNFHQFRDTLRFRPTKIRPWRKLSLLGSLKLHSSSFELTYEKTFSVTIHYLESFSIIWANV